MSYIPWWQRMTPPTFAERFDLGGLAGRVGFNDGSPRKIYKVIRVVTDVDRIQNPNIPKEAKYKVQLPSGEGSGTSTTMKYTTTEAQANKAIKDAELRWKNYERPKKDIIPDNPADYAEDVRTRKTNVGLKKISTVTVDENIKKITYVNKATGEKVIKYKAQIIDVTGANTGNPIYKSVLATEHTTLEDAKNSRDNYRKNNPKNILLEILKKTMKLKIKEKSY